MLHPNRQNGVIVNLWSLILGFLAGAFLFPMIRARA
jgi:hypothetical protein